MMNGVVLYYFRVRVYWLLFNIEVPLFGVKSEDPGSGMLVFNPLGCAAGYHFGVIFLSFSGKT